MRITSKKKVGVAYTPLDVSVEIVPYGGTADRQVYNSNTGGFYPDYEDGALCLFPVCHAVNSRDVSGAQEDDYINNASTFTFTWHELTYNASTKTYVKGDAITSGKNGYEIVNNTQDGLVRGMLLVRKNSSVLNPIRLQFEGRYADPKSGQIYKYVAQKNIICDDMEETMPVLHVTPGNITWNPVVEPQTVTFEAVLTDGSGNITDAKNTMFKWYRKVNVQGTSYDLQLIDGTHQEDVDVVSMSSKTITVDGKDTTGQGNTLTIDKNLVGDREMYVCKAMRRVALKSSDTFDDRDPYAEMSITRSMPDYNAYIVGLPNTADPDQQTVNPRCVINVGGKELTDEEISKNYNVYWTVQKKGEADETVVSTEINPEIEFEEGMTIGLGIEEKGAQRLLTGTDGAVMADESGNLMYNN